MDSADEYKKAVKYFLIFYILMVLGAIPSIVVNILYPNAFLSNYFYVLFSVTNKNDYCFYGTMVFQSACVVLFTLFLRLQWTVVADPSPADEEDKHPYSKRSRTIRRSITLACGFIIFGGITTALIYFYVYFQDNFKISRSFSEIKTRDIVLALVLFAITYITEILLYGLVNIEVHERRSKDESALFWKKFAHRILVLYAFTIYTSIFMEKEYCYLSNIIFVYFAMDSFMRNLLGMLLPFMPSSARTKQIMLSEEYIDMAFKYYVSTVYTNLIPSLSLISIISLAWNRLYFKYRLKREEGPIESNSRLTKHLWAAILLCTLASLFFSNFSTTFVYLNSKDVIYPYCFQ